MTLKLKMVQAASLAEALLADIKKAHSIAYAENDHVAASALEILICDLIEDIANLTNRIHRINAACK